MQWKNNIGSNNAKKLEDALHIAIFLLFHKKIITSMCLKKFF